MQGEYSAHPLISSLDPIPQRREARRQEQANNPFYIKSSPSPQKVRLDSLSWRNGPGPHLLSIPGPCEAVSRSRGRTTRGPQ